MFCLLGLTRHFSLVIFLLQIVQVASFAELIPWIVHQKLNFTTRVAQNTVANKGNQHFLLFFTRTRRRVHLNHRGALNYKLYTDNYTGGTRVSKMRRRRTCPINKSRDNEDKSSAIRNAAPLFLVTRRCN